MIYKFTEVLNDLVNYFFLSDILLLEKWKEQNNLSDNLGAEFISNESGDRVFYENIAIPMMDIENYPYIVLFNLSNDIPELCKQENKLQIRKSGYYLKIENNILIAVRAFSPPDKTEAFLRASSPENNMRPKNPRT